MKRNLKYLCYALVGVIAVVTIIEVVLLLRVFVAGSKIPDEYTTTGTWVPIKEECVAAIYKNGVLQDSTRSFSCDSIRFGEDSIYHEYGTFGPEHVSYHYAIRDNFIRIGDAVFVIQRLDEDLYFYRRVRGISKNDTIDTIYYHAFRRK